MDIDIYNWRITAIEAVNADSPTPEHRRIAIHCGNSLLKLWLDDVKASQLREALDKLYPRILEPESPHPSTDRYADEHAGEFTEPNPNAPLPLTPADIEALARDYRAGARALSPDELEALKVEHTARVLNFVQASLNRTHET